MNIRQTGFDIRQTGSDKTVDLRTLDGVEGRGGVREAQRVNTHALLQQEVAHQRERARLGRVVQRAVPGALSSEQSTVKRF